MLSEKLTAHDLARLVEEARAERDRYLADRNLLYTELKEAHTWLEAAGIDDCEHRGSEGTRPCRFATVLQALEGSTDA